MLTVQFHKEEGKPVILKCIRKDGSATWSKIHPNTEYHDLAHIAIEEVLGFRNAFYGLIASGFNIQDFELPEAQKPSALKGINLPEESIITEHLVNLLTIEKFNGPLSNFIAQASQILREHDLTFPQNLNEDTLDRIRSHFNNLIVQWKQTANYTYFEKVISFGD